MTRITILAALLAGPAMAQPNVQAPDTGCGPHAERIAKFAKDYGEHVVGMGIHVDGRLFETLVDFEDGSWSVLSTAPGGLTCLVAGGDAWQGGLHKPGRGA